MQGELNVMLRCRNYVKINVRIHDEYIPGCDVYVQ